MTPEGTVPRPPQSRPPLPRRLNVGIVDGVRRPVDRTPLPPRPHVSRPIPVSFGGPAPTEKPAATFPAAPAPEAPQPQPPAEPQSQPELPEPESAPKQLAPVFMPPAQPLTFEPKPAAPKKPRRQLLQSALVMRQKLHMPGKRVMMALAGLTAVAVLGGGIYAYIGWQARQRDPAVLVHDALTSSLTLRQVAVSSSTPDGSMQANLDFNDIKNPLVSADGQIIRAGVKFGIATYGSRDNTYFSYTDLPSSVNQTIADSARNAWVQVRAKGVLPKGVSQQLASLADPRYQDFGPVVVGNFGEQDRQQISQFLIDHNVYKVTALKAAVDTLNGKKVYVLPVTINTGYLKTAVQSAALAENFSPDDIASVSNTLDAYNDATGKLYVTADGHRLVRLAMTISGNNYTFDYANFNNVQVDSEPQTHLTWAQFSPVEWQIESQTASRQPAAALDVERQAALKGLHDALAAYFNQNNDYPNYASLNDGSWLSNMGTVDPALQRDPLAVNLDVANAPKAGAYAYLPTQASGKGGCDDISIQCAHYRLVAVLSNGKQYTVQDP